jgi:hypothetical protein
MHGYTTVIVGGMGYGLVTAGLRGHGFHVLEADDWEHVLDTTRTHSRPIHLVVADVSMECYAPVLKQHRPDLLFYFITSTTDIDAALTRIRQLLGPLVEDGIRDWSGSNLGNS